MKFIFIERHAVDGMRQRIKKILTIMKLTAFLLMMAFVQVSARGYGQVTLHEKNAPFEKVMASIRKQTSFTIFYNERIRSRLITIDVENASIHEALDKCFQNLPIRYKIVGNSIFLKETESPPELAKPVAEALIQFTSVSGTILNEENRPVEGASIFIKGSTVGTRTNANGYFRLELVADNAVLRISCIGYLPVDVGVKKFKDGYLTYAMQKEQAENVVSNKGREVAFTVRLITAVGNLKSISINADSDAPKQIGTVVDLKHRNHLNLGQVLEGSIPGLTLKSTTTTNKEVSFNMNPRGEVSPNETYTGVDRLRELYNSFGPETRIQYPTFEIYYNLIYSLANNASLNDIYNTTTTTNSGLVPELRGSSSFTGNTSGMLVVIDGVEQSGFPANYPMNNVAKIEVIKDPAELIKWGAKATGGLILITTNGAKAGKLQFNYNANFYYSRKPDISNKKLRLASSADVLSYYKEQVDRGLASYIPVDGDFTLPPEGLKPAQWLLYNLKKKGLEYTDPKFVTSWDSLARLSNSDQLRNLYQDVVRQSHSLNIAGGTRHWGFSLGGIYSHSPNANLGSKSSDLQLNLQNKFSLLKNKLNITLQLNTKNTSEQNSTGDNGSSLDPYQMLLSPNLAYVYDYPNRISEEINTVRQQMGFENEGINPLEDALSTNNRRKTSGINSRLSAKWDLSKSLRWSTAAVYNRNDLKTRNHQSSVTSQVRQLRNTYASPDSIGGVKMYIPAGDIVTTEHSRGLDWSLRSGLNYNQTFNVLHVLTGAFGLGATNSQSSTIPNSTIYGYGPNTPGGLPILPFPEEGILDYYSVVRYPTALQARNPYRAFYDRSFSINGNLGYTYDNRYMLSALYSSVYTPSVGFLPSYSGTKNYEAKASWMISKEAFFKTPTISTLTLSAIAGKIQVGQLPDLITTNVIAQPLWNNTSLMASGYTPSQLNGQRINNIGGALQIGFWQERIAFYASYNHSSDGSHQVNGQVAYQIDREPWFHVPFINRLIIDASLQNFNSLQAQSIVMGTNTPDADGGFSLANNFNFGVLPPATINKEAHLTLGMFKDRLILDARYYRKTLSSTSGSGLLPPDPSTGIASQLSYSRLLNRGVELYVKGKVVNGKAFNYTITINGAYNVNEALDIPDIPFSQYPSYLTALRTGYATDALWSYRWAGLDNLGNPQVYKDIDTKVPVLSGTDLGNPVNTTLDASSLVYSGRLRAPWSGGIIQEWTYKDFFASVRLVANLGHVMRTYIPVAGTRLDKSILIGQRWQKPGDEAYTDIAAMAQFNSTRSLVIQNSSNSIVSASNIRLNEIQFGYELPAAFLGKNFIKAFTIAAQVQNVALWTRNKLQLDPDALSSNGMVGIQRPRQYILTINANF
jgi:hypothetical protein